MHGVEARLEASSQVLEMSLPYGGALCCRCERGGYGDQVCRDAQEGGGFFVVGAAVARSFQLVSSCGAPLAPTRAGSHENTSTLLMTLKHSSKFSGKAESGIGSQQTLVLLPSLALPFASISSISSRISMARWGAQMQCSHSGKRGRIVAVRGREGRMRS